VLATMRDAPNKVDDVERSALGVRIHAARQNHAAMKDAPNVSRREESASQASGKGKDLQLYQGCTNNAQKGGYLS